MRFFIFLHLVSDWYENKDMEVKEKIMLEFIITLMEKDYKSIKMDDIAKKLRISKKTIYECFESKEVLLEQSFTTYQTKFYNNIVNEYLKIENPLERILSCMYDIFVCSKTINISKIKELQKSNTKVFTEVLARHLVFVNTFILPTIKQAQDKGYIFKEIDSELLLVIMFPEDFVEVNERTKLKKYNSEYDIFKLGAIHFFAVMRGIATSDKGIKTCDEFFEKMEKDIRNKSVFPSLIEHLNKINK